jgi:hypothetical protein
MPDYYVIRSSTQLENKAWILKELKAGKLRQGWFAHKGMTLVDQDELIILEEIWIKKFRAVTRSCYPRPKTDKQRKWVSRAFALGACPRNSQLVM